MGHPDESRLKWSVRILGIAGVSSTVLGFLYSENPKYGRLGTLGEALGVALVVAIVMAVLIDSASRRQLQRNVFLALFGRDAPKAYMTALADFCRSIDRVSTKTEVVIEFSWTDETREIVRLDADALQVGKNISSEIYTYDHLLLIPSVEPRRSTFRYFDIEVTPRDEEKKPEKREVLEHALASAATEGASGCTEVDLERLDAALKIQSGERYRIQQKATLYLQRHAAFPLATDGAHLEGDLTLRGNALSDLDIQVLNKGHPIPPEHNEEGADVRYKLGVTFPGQSTVVLWRPQTGLEDRVIYVDEKTKVGGR
jgi:hypothetical protein